MPENRTHVVCAPWWAVVIVAIFWIVAMSVVLAFRVVVFVAALLWLGASRTVRFVHHKIRSH